jgi:hypothetical protein
MHHSGVAAQVRSDGLHSRAGARYDAKVSVHLDDEDLRQLARGRRGARVAVGRKNSGERIAAIIKSSHPAVFACVIVALLLAIVAGPVQVLVRLILSAFQE